MKETFQKEYLRQAPLVLQSKLNSSNKIKAINTWAVSLMSYGAGIIGWKEDEHMQTDDNGRYLNPKGDAGSLYVGKKVEGSSNHWKLN